MQSGFVDQADGSDASDGLTASCNDRIRGRRVCGVNWAMLLPYALPHECESEEIARALGGLTPKQRRALRAYVWQVELGEQTVTGWLASDTCPVARQSWYRSDGGYWG